MKEQIKDQNWDVFWKVVSSKPLLLKFLYYSHFKKYKALLSKIPLAKPKILELGAGTGVLAQRLLELFGGEAILVDNNTKAFELFQKFKKDDLKVAYLQEDIFNLKTQNKFDLVFSDGLVEHFEDKKAILDLHKKHLKKEGSLFFFVPHASKIFSFLNKIGPQACASKVFTKQDLLDLCQENGLEVINSVASFFEIGVLCRVKN